VLTVALVVAMVPPMNAARLTPAAARQLEAPEAADS
jgi:hypothetical protein